MLKTMECEGRRGFDWEPHHVLFEANAWCSNPEAQRLRSRHELIVPMFVAPHDELHVEIPFVPLLDNIQVYHINRGFQRKDTPLKNISELLRCLNVSIEKFDTPHNENNLNNVLRVQVGLLAIKSVEAQVPHIRDGMYKKALRPRERRRKVDRRRGGITC